MAYEAVIERIKNRVAAVDPDGPRKVLGVFQLNITSDDYTYNWIVDLKKLIVSEGKIESADVTIDINSEVFLAIGSKTLTIKDAIDEKKIIVEGDQALATALIEQLNM